MSYTFVLPPGPLQRGSHRMRGQDISDELHRLGIPSQVVSTDELEAIPEDTEVLIVVKHPIDPRTLPAGPCKVYDVLDTLSTRGKVPFLNHWDGLLVPSPAAVDHLRTLGYRGRITVSWHHWDPRLDAMPARSPDDALQWGYMGTAACIHQKLEFTNFFVQKGLKVLDTESGTDVTAEVAAGNKLENMTRAGAWSQMQVPFNVHLCFRKGHERWLGTNTKLSTAAALGHPAIVTSDSAYVSLLPGDYPYQTEDRHQALRVYKQMKEDQKHQNERWLYALEAMRSVKQDTSLEACAVRLASAYPLKTPRPTQVQRMALQAVARDGPSPLPLLASAMVVVLLLLLLIWPTAGS